MDQLRIACGRGWDHEAHTWLSDDTRFCPGKVSKPLAHAGDAGVAAWEPDESGPEREAVQAAPEAPEAGDGGVEPSQYPHKKGVW